MKTKEPTAGDVPLIGGALCLDFTNTVGSRLNGAGSDMLRDYADLLAWSVHAGALKAAEARGLLRAAARRPHAARAVRLRAIRLRSALYAVLHARVDGQAPRAGQLALLNRELARALARARLAKMPGHARRT